jgi:hypothetical protein
MLARIGISLANDPSGRIADSQIEDLALLDEGIERLHQLRDRGSKVPSVDIVNIDVIHLETLHAVVDGHTHTLSARSTVVALLHSFTEDRG